MHQDLCFPESINPGKDMHGYYGQRTNRGHTNDSKLLAKKNLPSVRSIMEGQILI